MKAQCSAVLTAEPALLLPGWRILLRFLPRFVNKFFSFLLGIILYCLGMFPDFLISIRKNRLTFCLCISELFIVLSLNFLCAFFGGSGLIHLGVYLLLPLFHILFNWLKK